MMIHFAVSIAQFFFLEKVQQSRNQKNWDNCVRCSNVSYECYELCCTESCANIEIWTLIMWFVVKRHCSNARVQSLFLTNIIGFKCNSCISSTTTTFMRVFCASQACIKSVSSQSLLWVTETKNPKYRTVHQNWIFSQLNTRSPHFITLIHLKFFHTHNSLAKLRICHTICPAHTKLFSIRIRVDIFRFLWFSKSMITINCASKWTFEWGARHELTAQSAAQNISFVEWTPQRGNTE